MLKALGPLSFTALSLKALGPLSFTELSLKALGPLSLTARAEGPRLTVVQRACGKPQAHCRSVRVRKALRPLSPALGHWLMRTDALRHRLGPTQTDWDRLKTDWDRLKTNSRPTQDRLTTDSDHVGAQGAREGPAGGTRTLSPLLSPLARLHWRKMWAPLGARHVDWHGRPLGAPHVDLSVPLTSR